MEKYLITYDDGDLFVYAKHSYEIKKVYWRTKIDGDEFFVTYTNIENVPVIIEGVFTYLTINDETAEQAIDDINKQLDGQGQVLGPYLSEKMYCLSDVKLESVDNTFVMVRAQPNIYVSDLAKILEKNDTLVKQKE